MRLSTDEDRDELRAVATIAAAAEAGVTVFDTAHAYGRDETELGHNERLLSRPNNPQSIDEPQAQRSAASDRVECRGSTARS